jgi:hypothetical protein
MMDKYAFVLQDSSDDEQAQVLTTQEKPSEKPKF